MGGNISLGKKTCDIPSNLPHGQEITLDFLQKYWSKDITSLKVEQLMVVTRVVDGEPEELAAAINFLTSEDAGFITGQVLCVDGGMSMW